ncbi:PH domain-containing protein [Candidatus Uhrbacteria bacterium]|nr:PH domain-containing protein [Candidatus Uhrbacteria bacterium]
MFDLKYCPSNEKDEKIILSLRRHGFILFKQVVGFLFFAAIPPAVAAIMNRLGAQISLSEVGHALVYTGLSIYYLGLVSYLYNGFVDYYLDNWIVTNHRIISIDENNLFNRTVSEQTLYRVQDVTAEAIGFLPTILNYGNIYVQTAAEKERFVFQDVPHAFENARLIEQLVGVDKETHKGMI